MPISDFSDKRFQKNIRYLFRTITPDQDGMEAGTFLRHELLLSSSLIKRIKYLDDGIFLDHDRITTRTRIKAGQTLRIRLSDIAQSGEIPVVPGPLDILYEDEDLIIVNKAAGLAVHPGIGHWEQTLGSFLLHYYDQKDIPADFHPVHRLDKGTSGVMVVAKHAYAQELLRQSFHSDTFSRQYLAVCDGIPKPPCGSIDYPLAHSAESVIRQEIRPDGLSAHTEYWLLQHTAQRSLVQLQLKTGRTHQIRLHMAAIGCPLTGDFLYGTENPALIQRPALHSYRLSFVHPVSKNTYTFTAPLPDDMAALLNEN